MYPKVKYPEKVGTYDAFAKSGGGYVWDEVLEYRVWCHPHNGAEDGEDYFYAFKSYEEALAFSKETIGSEEPLALIFQKECIGEPTPGKYIHIKEPRITEWCVEWLNRPKRNENTIPEFIALNAPSDKRGKLRSNSPKRNESQKE